MCTFPDASFSFMRHLVESGYTHEQAVAIGLAIVHVIDRPPEDFGTYWLGVLRETFEGDDEKPKR